MIFKVDFHRLCHIHSEYNKLMDFTNLVCLYKLYRCKASIYITRAPSYSKWIFTGCVMDLKILGCLYQTLPLQILYLGYQSIAHSRWTFTGCVPSTLNTIRDLKKYLDASIKLYHCKASIKLPEHCLIQSGLSQAVSHSLWIQQGGGFENTGMPL